ncbi:MAG: helix-turn-helix transcriptional regulator [Gaiellaceae bacterium]
MDALTAVGDPKLRAALLFVRAEDHGVTADELAEHDGVHRNVARDRLERLAAAGLVETGFRPRDGGPGAGRPAKTYRAAPETTGIEFPARHYEDLVALLADGRADLRAVGEAFGRSLARQAGLRGRRSLEDVCAALRSLGFQAAVEDGAIVTPTCPLRPLVVAQPQLAAIDEGMWAGLAGGRATCKATGCLDCHASCRVQLTLGRP